MDKGVTDGERVTHGQDKDRQKDAQPTQQDRPKTNEYVSS